jgi:hypothetical protein
MPNKNDLSAFKSKATKPSILTKEKPAQKRGRKAKDISEKESETVALKLTKSEVAALEKNAGLVPKGAFIKEILRTKTSVFK